ncbi:MAG TPA: J domain-containing protein [Anaerolineae bacterium]|mgnify:CR=1 FL=1|nr:J domain-containing protein [Anaerolineae bacterium]MCB0177208.1 J domain-containing protein [Anaerolineae bacterium]MCB9108357.1 J domain-containing protein [Anaerolineales bacterium]HRV91212.1 J domain-containing protein [Anaerolineae bacterium]
MEYKDYYKTLGVSKNATEKEIKSAYRKLARQHHPDVNPDNPSAEARFKEVNEAYEVLGDAEKRKKYDQLGADWRRWEQAGQNGGFDWSQWMGGMGNAGGPGGPRVRVQYGRPDDLNDLFGNGGGGFSDFFNAIFGDMGMGSAGGRSGFRSQPQGQIGQDIEQELEISLTEAYHGTTRLLSKDGRRLEVKIPAGAKTGTKVRMRGEGQPGYGGQAGDLYLKVKVAHDPRFERRGDNLHVTVPVDLYTAVLGGEVRVPTMTGDVKLKIPAGAQNGQKFRLRGKGMPKLRHKNEYGDLYAQLEVKLPKSITPEQRTLFEKLRDMG